jgi:hypothetical protein
MSIPEDAQKCLKELTYYVDSMLGNVELSDMKRYDMNDDVYEIIDKHLFSLACYMRGDDKNYGVRHRNSEVTTGILDGVRAIRKKLDEANTPAAKNLSKHLKTWLRQHMGKGMRYKNVSSKKCGGKAGVREEMPVYMLNAITKEKPAHPVYGNLRY